MSNFVYSQVIKEVEVERRVLVGEGTAYRERLCQVGLSGRINTSFIARLNLTIRQPISKLTATLETDVVYALARYNHFVRPHESLAVELGQPVHRKGRQLPRKYRKRTPGDGG